MSILFKNNLPSQTIVKLSVLEILNGLNLYSPNGIYNVTPSTPSTAFLMSVDMSSEFDIILFKFIQQQSFNKEDFIGKNIWIYSSCKTH